MRGAAALLALGLLGCAGGGRDAFQQSLSAGDRAKSAGRYDEAIGAYHDAGEAAKKGRDRDEGYFREAATLDQAGRHQEAMAAYERLIAQSPKGERTPRAIFERAWLEIHHGDAERGWKMLEQALFEQSPSGSARRAVRQYLDHLDEKQPGAGHAWLDANRERLLKTEIAEDTLYLIAKALQAEGRKAEARVAYVECAERFPYPYGSLADDSWWNAAELAAELGDPRASVDYLKKLLAPREVATMKQGSYERPRYAAAQYRLAELFRDKLGDEAQARREFHKVYRDHTTSILRDDALWNEALLARKAGDQPAVCEVMGALAKDFPKSRYSGCTSQLCPSVSPSSEAPACRGYLKAALGVPE